MVDRNHAVCKLTKGIIWGCATFVLVVTPTLAQVLEEVIVTAQKREQNIQEVGIAITAFTGDQLDQLNFRDSTQIQTLTPGLHLSTLNGGQTRQFTIRGVTQNGFDGYVEAPNAIYIDEGYLFPNQSATFAMFDMERVEVLKGPQGTLFGRNATGGLVQYITRKPTDTFEGYGDVLYGSHNQVRVEGAVSGPLTPTLSGRVAGMFQKWDAFYNNIYPDQIPTVPIFNPITFTFPQTTLLGSTTGPRDLGDDEQYALRGHLLWDPNDDVDLLVTGFYAQQGDISSGAGQQVATTPVLNAAGAHVNTIFSRDDPNNCEGIRDTGGCVDTFFGLDGDIDGVRPRPGGDLFGYIDRDGDDFEVSTDHVANINNYESWGATGKLTWEMANDILMTAVLHYIGYETMRVIDVDAAPVPQSTATDGSESETFTAELRFDGEFERARWVAGFYYLFIDSDYEVGLQFPPFSPITLSPILFAGLPVESTSRGQLETNSYSLFGQLDMDLTDQLTFIAGLRVIREEKDFMTNKGFFLNTDDALTEGFQRGFTPLPIPTYPAFAGKTSDTLWAGKLQFDYRLTDDVLLYAGINRGVKAGSFNNKVNDLATPTLTPEETPYKEEVLTAYEVGFKSTLFNGTTRFNGSFYYYDYDDYQAFTFEQSSGFIRNNDAKFKGIELEIQTSPLDGLDFLFNVGLIDAEITGLEVANSVFRDVTPAFTPQVQLGGLIRYEWPNNVFGGGTFAVQADAYYASSNYHNIRNYEAQQMDARRIGNVKASWYSADEHWEATVFVDNVADERYVLNGFDLSTLCGCDEQAYGLPRWAGGRIRYSWGG